MGRRDASCPRRVEPARIEITFEQNHGGEAVHRLGAFFDADAALAQYPLRFHGSEALVPKFDRQSSGGLKARSKLVRVAGLTALLAAHVDGVADHDAGDVVGGSDLAETG